MRTRIIGCVLLLGLSLPAVGRAQAAGRVAGAVTSDEGRPVPNAQISVQGTRLGARTDSSGHYRILNVPAGQHSIRA
ncbi:MAG TPA: carboxypeptidase regulatory-like domain-containing protein, partial [Gemmatimonadaceae bacterium]|nr:carboxypeptidase regulatory-like domain-containing protein [Gemmatimonadaceae bacterium]